MTVVKLPPTGLYKYPTPSMNEIYLFLCKLSLSLKTLSLSLSLLLPWFLALKTWFCQTFPVYHETVEREATVMGCPCVELDFEKWLSTLFPEASFPQQGHHHINIIPGTEPVNWRPFRQSHQQKKRIEKIVPEMLSSDII